MRQQRKQQTQLVTLGAASVPIVPVSHFSKLDREVIEMAWQIVGPSVQMNLGNSRRAAPLWAVFAACYAEGLHHGYELAKEKLYKDAAEEVL
jgi:hypothetical protein